MYSTISQLGKSVNYKSEQTDPLTYCLYPDYNSQWIHGSTSSNLLNTPYCAPCQSYMADRCSKNWDNACDIYTANNCDTYWPNTAAIDVASQKRAQHFLQYTPTSGDNLIRNSAERHFFTYPEAIAKASTFDPNVTESPKYTTYSCNTTAPTWEFHPQVLQGTLLHDENPHVQAMLNNPKACFDLLARFHQVKTNTPLKFNAVLHKSKPTTQLQGFLNANSKIFSQFNSRYSSIS